MTLSIAAWDQKSGQLGAAIASSSISVASRCLHWRAGIGIALSQNITDPRLGPRLLTLLETRRISGSRARNAARLLDALGRLRRYLRRARRAGKPVEIAALRSWLDETLPAHLSDHLRLWARVRYQCQSLVQNEADWSKPRRPAGQVSSSRSQCRAASTSSQ